mmetsp:Transcript_94182/g.215453  ORF Transcript_94182/g.215453 Transcript_94182/m.215453 type:complete len:359 (-) Transcript_94182:95-1171(-)
MPRGGPDPRGRPAPRTQLRGADIVLGDKSASTMSGKSAGDDGFPGESLPDMSSGPSGLAEFLQEAEHGQSTREMMTLPPIMFPTNKPSSRADAVILDEWITFALQSFAAKTQTKEELSEAVEELVPVLSIGLHEVVRQVTHHCVERGVVLEKIWRTYVELFDRVLHDLRSSLKLYKERTKKVSAKLEKSKSQLAAMKQKHPEQLAKLTTTLEVKFSQRQRELEDQLQFRESENYALKAHRQAQDKDIQMWFPEFETYSDSPLKQQLLSRDQPIPLNENGTPAEVAIGADFKRLLAAMSEKQRQHVGFFVSSLLYAGASTEDDSREKLKALQEKHAANKSVIEKLRAEVEKMKAEKGLA